MSRFIDPNRPYTDEEKEYLLTRANGEDLIIVNERRFADVTDEDREAFRERAARDDHNERQEQEARQAHTGDDPDDYHPDDIATVQDMTIQDIRLALEKRKIDQEVTEEDMVIPDTDETLTEKQVLAYRLLDSLDEARKG